MFDNPLKSTHPQGVVGQSPRLERGVLIDAYAKGIFPWPQRDGRVLWISPVRRGILRFDEFHVAGNLRRFARNSSWTLTFDRCFGEVVRACQASVRKGQDFTWITDDIVRAYGELADVGLAHSVECWDEDDRLIGGCYGVWNGRGFTGESMFYAKSNASKLALLALVQTLGRSGLSWIDIQIVSPYMASVGGRLVERSEYYRMFEALPDRVLDLPARIAARDLAN